MLLIIANFIVTSVATSLATSCNKVHWFFWVIIAGLITYNFFDIKRNREEYTRVVTIVFVITTLLIIGGTWYWVTVQNCH